MVDCDSEEFIKAQKEMKKETREITITGTLHFWGEKGQMTIKGEAEEALASILMDLSPAEIEEVKKIAPNFCKEQGL